MPPSKSTTKKKNFLSKLSTRLIISLVAIALAAGGFYLYRAHKNDTAQIYAYSYKKLTPYKLSGAKDGSGVSLNMPTEFTTESASKPQLSQTQFSQAMAKNDGSVVIIAHLAIASVYSGTPPSAGYLQKFSKTLTDTTSPAYNGTIQPIKDFVNRRLPTAHYNVSFDKTAAFTSDNIKTDAWQLDFTAKTKNPANERNFPPLKGKEILAVGKSTFYYFMVDAIDYNWQSKSNQSIWQQVINSLKIDQ